MKRTDLTLQAQSLRPTDAELEALNDTPANTFVSGYPCCKLYCSHCKKIFLVTVEPVTVGECTNPTGHRLDILRDP